MLPNPLPQKLIQISEQSLNPVHGKTQQAFKIEECSLFLPFSSCNFRPRIVYFNTTRFS